MHFKQVMQALYYIKPLLNFISVACLGFIVYLFLVSTINMQNAYAMPSLLLAVWSLLMSALIGLYSHKPSTDNVDKGWFARMKSKVGKGLFNMVSLIFALVTFALLYVTIRLLRL